MLCVSVWDEGQEVLMLNLYFVYNGHCKFFLGDFNNVDELIERMEDHQWAFLWLSLGYLLGEKSAKKETKHDQ